VNKVAQMPAEERADLFAETAARKALQEAIIEKDFWVCWMLKQLFSIDDLTGRLLFKGGTSLSKIFHAISRFSEDIDLAVDYVALGFKAERDPRRQDISKTKRIGILDEMMEECRRYVGGEFLDILKAHCGEILGATDAWSLSVREQDPNVVQFRYPTAIPRSCLSWERTRNLCRMIALRSVHSLPKNFRMLLSMETLQWSRCSRSGPFGKRHQFFMRNITACPRNQSPNAIRVITMTLRCWPKGQYEPTLWPTGIC